MHYRIAITGSNGFLGNHLYEFLNKRNFECIGIQRYFENNKKIRIIENINGNTDWSKALKGIDVIIHCAGIAHKLNIAKDDSLDIFREVNIEGTKKLIIAATENKVKRFIFISSIKVNGEKTKISSKFLNNSAPNPIDKYAFSKYEAEKIVQKYCKKNQMEYVIIRPPLIYGPGVKGNFLRLIKLINLNLPLPFGNIKNKRSMVFVVNLCDLICKCITYSKASGKILLISDNEVLSTSKLIKIIQKFLNSKTYNFPVPEKLLVFSFKLIKKYSMVEKLVESLEIIPKDTYQIMDWQPPYSVEYGLKATVSWFKKKYHNNV